MPTIPRRSVIAGMVIRVAKGNIRGDPPKEFGSHILRGSAAAAQTVEEFGIGGITPSKFMHAKDGQSRNRHSTLPTENSVEAAYQQRITSRSLGQFEVDRRYTGSSRKLQRKRLPADRRTVPVTHRPFSGRCKASATNNTPESGPRSAGICATSISDAADDTQEL